MGPDNGLNVLGLGPKQQDWICRVREAALKGRTKVSPPPPNVQNDYFSSHLHCAELANQSSHPGKVKNFIKKEKKSS